MLAAHMSTHRHAWTWGNISKESQRWSGAEGYGLRRITGVSGHRDVMPAKTGIFFRLQPIAPGTNFLL